VLILAPLCQNANPLSRGVPPAWMIPIFVFPSSAPVSHTALLRNTPAPGAAL
jgi:hypothetical protein